MHKLHLHPNVQLQPSRTFNHATACNHIDISLPTQRPKCDNKPCINNHGIAALTSQVQVDSFHPNHRVKTHGTFRQTTAHEVSKCAPSTTVDIPSQEGFSRFPFSTTACLPTARRVFILLSLLSQDTAANVPCSRVTDTPPDDLAAQALGACLTQRLTPIHSQNFHSNTQLTHQASIHPEHTTVSKTLFLVLPLLVPGCLLVSRSRISNFSIQLSLHHLPLEPPVRL